ncbi:MAG: hypothetical protein ABSC92_02595 [Rhizomicrobium sp.]|jgi:hypothetical protein
MTAPRFIVIDGKRHLWRDILKLRKEQVQAAANAKQPALFVLVDDSRPRAERTAAGRYNEPSLFKVRD